MIPEQRVDMLRSAIERQMKERDRLATLLREQDEAITYSCGEFMQAVEAARRSSREGGR